jgi:phosphatidylethanolamine-binding protein (PEBP) family uncharacterized protein
MKYAFRILLGMLLIMLAGISFLAFRASRARLADDAYHAALAKTLGVSSESFGANGKIPATSCKGGGSSPQVGWDHAPTGTMSYVITMVDWDVPTRMLRLNAFTHWILYDIQPPRH